MSMGTHFPNPSGRSVSAVSFKVRIVKDFSSQNDPGKLKQEIMKSKSFRIRIQMALPCPYSPQHTRSKT